MSYDPSTEEEQDELVNMMAELMSDRLLDNMGKRHWLATPRVELMQNLLAKVERFRHYPTIRLAADIANYAAMIADQAIVETLDELNPYDGG